MTQPEGEVPPRFLIRHALMGLDTGAFSSPRVASLRSGPGAAKPVSLKSLPEKFQIADWRHEAHFSRRLQDRGSAPDHVGTASCQSRGGSSWLPGLNGRARHRLKWVTSPTRPTQPQRPAGPASGGTPLAWIDARRGQAGRATAARRSTGRTGCGRVAGACSWACGPSRPMVTAGVYGR
jgi:hypothetical protein